MILFARLNRVKIQSIKKSHCEVGFFIWGWVIFHIELRMVFNLFDETGLIDKDDI